MIKRIFFITTLALLPLVMSARGGMFEYGIKGGITTQGVRFVNNKAGEYKISTSPKTGFHAGIMTRINLSLMHIQPEILYSYNRYEMRAVTSGADVTSSTVRVKTFDVPVLAGLRLLWFRFQAGPMFNLSTDTSVNTHGKAQHSATMFRSTVSYVLGVGFDMRGINLDIRYNGQFKRAEQNTIIGKGDSFERKLKLRSWMFSLGYMF